ncbi:MAG TPA: polymer-forming cytoskeletal protein [Pyrinomonadaceae bacterium]|nr:polymer-forming cytoskeletal protein [Pyrinomonadaceae bacterium]
MTFAKSDILHSADLRLFLQRLIFAAFFLFLIVFSAFAQTSLSQPDENTIVVEEAKEMEVFSIGKTVIVKREAKGVLALGGDVIIEGRVEGDVATIGGSVIQKENAFIGGDVIIFGGTYKPEAGQPLRNPGKQTVMYAGYEEELRNLTQSPSQIFAPQFSWSFLAQRILSVLFWFIVSLALTTIAPGAVSRAVARFQLSTLKVFGLGLLGIFVTTFGVLLSLSFLPNYVGAIVSLMAFVLLMLAYVFGRVALQASTGKWIQKRILPDKKQSETVALLIGAFVWALLLSIPYIWTFTLLALFAASLGLVLTARSSNSWQKV